MAPSGIPSRKIGTPTSTPGDFALGDSVRFPYLWITPANPGFDPLSFDWDTDVAMLTPESPLVTSLTSLNIDKFTKRGGKIIWYHGISDPGPPVTLTTSTITRSQRRAEVCGRSISSLGFISFQTWVTAAAACDRSV